MKNNFSLTEPGVRYFLSASLQKCNEKRICYESFLINLFLFFGFLGILSSILYYKYKSKLTDKEKKEKEKKKQTYFVDKIKLMSEKKQKEYNLLITNLPKFENEFRPNNKIFI